ncbi:LIC11612 family fibronectin-binding protein [Leptospira koniambonensis]|uniref:LIC11612 family fibronectin-binding protein n=1 Tax=Leptospira koniambonensis TaxID=2484950 RepID=UPI003EBD2D9A
MNFIPKFEIKKLGALIVLVGLVLLGPSLQTQSSSSERKDSPIGLVVYCPLQSEKETPFDFERTLGLWYKRYKQQKIQEGGGAILLVSAPHLPKTSNEIERLKKSLGAEIIFTGHHSVIPKKETVKPSDKKGKKKKITKKKKKPVTETKTNPEQSEKLTPVKHEDPKPQEETSESKPKNQTSEAKPKISSKKKGKKKAPKLSAKTQPVIPPGILTVKEEAGLNFVFYSPSLESLQEDEKRQSHWMTDFKSQFSKTFESQIFHFLLAQDPSEKPKEDSNPIAEGLSNFKKELSDTLPSIVLLSSPRALRFFNGEYSFGCGATPDSLKISVLELFFRNGRLIRINEEVQTLNSKESNKSWILE